MSARHYYANGMDLSTARRIGTKPKTFRPRVWERALRILMRWAAEPCRDREYQQRLNLCRKVHVCIIDLEAMIERKRNRKWRPRKNGTWK